MAQSLPTRTWKWGFVVAAPGSTPSWADSNKFVDGDNQQAHYRCPKPVPQPTTHDGNSEGVSMINTWPDLYNGTLSTLSLLCTSVPSIVCDTTATSSHNCK